MNRYQQLAASGAVAEQTLTNQQATVDSNQSSYDDANTLLQKAQENLDDTIIRAPISGKLSVDDVPSGTYVTPGNTALDVRIRVSSASDFNSGRPYAADGILT